MPNTREKLIELIIGGHQKYYEPDSVGNTYEVIAENLIRNGVGFVEHDCHWATEQAYKNGYEKGYADGERKGNGTRMAD